MRRDVLLPAEFDGIIEHNVLRALESAVAVSEFVVSEDGGWEYVESRVQRFYLLQPRNVIDAELTERLADAMRFLTIARKEFEHLDVQYIETQAQQWSNDLTQFADDIIKQFGLVRVPLAGDDAALDESGC